MVLSATVIVPFMVAWDSVDLEKLTFLIFFPRQACAGHHVP